MDAKRRRTSAATLRALDAEIRARRAELGALERSRDIVADKLAEPKCASAIHSGGTICCGDRHVGRCTACGFVALVCEQHDGARTVAKILASHQCRFHASPDDDPRLAERAPDDAIALPDDAPVPVGQLSLSPVD